VSELHTNAPTAAEQANGQAARDKAQEAAGRAQDKAQEAAGQAKHRLRSEVDGRSTQAGERLRSSAGDVRSVAAELRNQGKDQPAELAEKAADRVERFGSYLHDSDGDKLLRDVEDFARQRPWAVVAGGLALGLAASRFLKASSGRRYQAASAPYDSRATPPAAAGSPTAPVPADSPPAPGRSGIS
jgi:ElaB/YqjD/DUF883 family membrane-anchored ribosome-binding protein